MNYRFRPSTLLTNIFGPKPEDTGKNWRTVTVLRPMMAPSASTLKKYLPDWDKKGSGSTPIRIRWGDEQRKALENAPPMPKIRREPKAPSLLPPANETARTGTSTETSQSPGGNSSENSSGSASMAPTDFSTGKKGTVNLPPPGPAPKPEVAGNSPPSSVPSGIKPPSAATQEQKGTDKVFDNEQQAIRSSESGIFDTNGFPLGDYANMIKERIKGEWLIPSNLEKSHGHTTLVFRIGKDGHFTSLHIVGSSGNNSLDLAAMRAVMNSDPFPALPKGFPGDHIGAKFVLSYNEP
jgi:protein TonB